MSDNKPVVIIAKIGAPYGVRGWVKVHSYTDPSDNVLSFDNWLLSSKGDTWQSVKVESSRAHGSAFVAKLTGINDRDAAAAITNKEVAIYREELPEIDEDEHYWADLLGLEVINEQQQSLGQVVDMFETGANDVLVVKDNKSNSEHLIPFVVDMYVKAVDLESKTMQVAWPDEFI